MNSHFNPNPSPLDSLSETQHQQLLAWLEEFRTAEVVRLVRRDPPEGFGLVLHPTTLTRWFARHKASLRPGDLQLASEIVALDSDSPAFDQATAATLRHLAFELSNSPRIGAKQFKTLSRWVLRLRDQEHEAQALALHRERLELERQKFEFNAARQVLNHAAGLSAISADPKMDDEDKIRAARLRIFGSAP